MSTLLQLLLAAVPIALVWNALTDHFTLDSFALGYVIALITLSLLRAIGIQFRIRHYFDQPLAVLIYALSILWTALVSSIQVVKLVLSPKIELKTGIVSLNTGDLSESQLLTALSAHGINMTPGQLVIDIADGGVLYIHCLELEQAQPVIEKEQAQRIGLLRRITGEDANE